MAKLPVSRRTFGGTIAVGMIALAGCAGDSDDTDGNPTDGPDDGETPMEDADNEETETSDPGDDGDEEEEEDDADEEDEEETDGMIRVVHGSPDAPNVDVYVDDDLVLDDVPFRAVSDYLTVPASAYDVLITAAGDEEAVVYDDVVGVEAGTAVTLVALGELEDDSLEVRSFEDDISAVGEGESRVKVVHVSPDTPNVDIVPAESEDSMFVDLAFGEASEPTTVPAGTYDLQVKPVGEGEAVASFTVELDGGTAYTAFAMGYADTESAPSAEPLDLTVAVDTAGD